MLNQHEVPQSSVVEHVKSRMFKTIPWNPILNTSASAMTSRVPDTASRHTRQVLFLLFHFIFLVCSLELGKWLPLNSINLEM